MATQQQIYLKNKSEIEQMKIACQMAAETLLLVGDSICEGMCTEDIDNLVYQDTIKKGATPATLGYRGGNNEFSPFPKSCCTSINNVICHGIPSKQDILKNGDIVNVDITTIYNGWHGDTSATFFIGTPTEETKKLVEITNKVLYLGIQEVKHGKRLGDIGFAIEDYVKKNTTYSVVKEYGGHGIGKEFHSLPFINHYGTRGAGLRMLSGMTFTIEPMLNSGKPEGELDKEDSWTVRTIDGSLSAQFEHTILVTGSGYEILTARSRPLRNSTE